jgi:hypothetical protein
MSSEEHILNEIENLLEAENMMYASSETDKTPVDWRDRTRGSSFKKNLNSEKQNEPFDEVTEDPFDILQEEEVEEPVDVDITTDTEREETVLFWYRNSSASIGINATDIMNEFLIEEGMTPFQVEEVPAEADSDTPMDVELEESEKTEAEEIAKVIHQVDKDNQTTPTIEAADEPQPVPTEEQQFVMNVLSETSFRDTSEQVSLVKTVTFEASPTKPGKIELNLLGDALDAMAIADSPTKVLMEEEPVVTPQKEELIAIDPTPVTPPQEEESDIIFVVDPSYCNASDSDEEEDNRRLRIQISDDDSYDSDLPFDEARPFDEKEMMKHPAVVMGQHDFSLYHTVQVNAVETFDDEHAADAQEAEVVDVLSPLRNLLTPRKWKGSPKTPSTVGESPVQGEDIEAGFGDGVVRSDLNSRFIQEDDEEHVEWKQVFCTKKKIYLMIMLAFLVVILIAVVAVIVGITQKDEDPIDRGINDFYKLTPTAGSQDTNILNNEN